MKEIVRKMKMIIRNCLYRYDFLRFIASGLWSVLHPKSRYRVDHLGFYREDATGPLQRDEALLLFALTKVLRPAVIVEFGFHYGHSAFNFLQAMPSTCTFFSYDIDDIAERIAHDRFQRFKNFHFVRKSQTDFCAADIANQKIDLCFLDASHLLELNQITFRKLEGSLSEGAVIVVHDTGTYMKQFLSPVHERHTIEVPDGWISKDEYQYCLEERIFVNWVLTDCPGFCEVHLHSKRTLRNGMTLIQKKYLLQTESINPKGN